MQLYYFISADGRQLGPVPGEQLVNCGITPDTLVWGQNMSGWAPANSVPEIVELFTSQMQPAQSQTSVKSFYYIGKDGQKLGPSSAEEVMNYGITPQTKVWCEGMTDWEDAGYILEFKVLFDKASVSELFRVLPDGSVEMINALDTVPSTENTPITAKSQPDPKQPFEPQIPEFEPESEYESEDKKGGVIWRVILIIAAILLALGIAYFLFNSNSTSSEPAIIVDETTGYEVGHEWVDLGLPSGTKWATCNIGASSPEDYGNFYAWGETSTKSEYNESNSATYNRSASDLRNMGIIDSNGNLTMSYDVARQNWGGSWRMPTNVEFEELVANCTWRWTPRNGIAGYEVVGPNGISIFLPAAGYFDNPIEAAFYWSSSAYDDNYNSCYLYFIRDNKEASWSFRYGGQSIRPVINEMQEVCEEVVVNEGTTIVQEVEFTKPEEEDALAEEIISIDDLPESDPEVELEPIDADVPEEDNKVFTTVEQMPQFPGGDTELLKWIYTHIKYPIIAMENNVQGRVLVQFVVTKDGSVGEVKVVRGVDWDLDKEAVRVVKTLPNFYPGKMNGQEVNVWYTLPINFKLQN